MATREDLHSAVDALDDERVAKARIIVEDDGELEIAQRAIDEHASTVVASDYFDRLLRSLDEPAEPMPTLARAAAREREKPHFRRA